MSRTKHPKRSFKIRQYIAAHSIVRLTFDFIIVNTIIAIVLAVVIALLVGDIRLSLKYTYAIYTELFGKEPNWSLPDQFLFQNVRAFLATLSLLSPSIFLGIIIYKFFVLKRENIVFRSKCELLMERGEKSIHIHFYIASSLRIHNLQFEAFLRTYETANEEDAVLAYPMNTTAIEPQRGWLYPLPYNYVPSRFKIRLPSSAPITLDIQADDKVVVHNGWRAIELDLTRGDFCELYVTARGDVPDLQASFTEMKRYRIPEDLVTDGLPVLITRYSRQKDKFIVDNWEDF